VGPRLEHDERLVEALEWLERLEPPTIGVPAHTNGQSVTVYMPNNDLDAKGGDPDKVASIRAAKVVQPRLLDGIELIYVWPCDDPPEGLGSLVDNLYQFGRGIDPAWATWEVVDAEPDDVLQDWTGTVFSPSPGGNTRSLMVPTAGTLESLIARHEAQGDRLTVVRDGRNVRQTFQQPPRPLATPCDYGSGPVRRVYELRRGRDLGAVPLRNAHLFAIEVRDEAFRRLAAALPDAPCRGVLVGGKQTTVRQRDRVRIVPLPSIGHAEADPSIRRVLVEIPRQAPTDVRDLRWTFDGLDTPYGLLVDTGDRGMLNHYAQRAREWTSITPLALSLDEADADRTAREGAARKAVRQALRHAGIRARVASIEVQQEPWSRKGQKADRFAPGRFGATALWHVRITFTTPQPGPMLLGNGRYLGLGLLRPVHRQVRWYAWRIQRGLSADANPLGVARALRRAVMARYQNAIVGPLPEWVSGHGSDGSRATGHRHIYVVPDLPRGRLLLHVPQRLYGEERRRFEAAVLPLDDLRAGRDGRLTLAPTTFDPEHDPLTNPASHWSTVSPYTVEHHRRLGSAREAVRADVLASLATHGHPAPARVEVTIVPGRRLAAKIDLTFDHPVAGPMLLGRTAHKGGGVFVGTS
jgi:CRISPR-associated protein Csb2